MNRGQLRTLFNGALPQLVMFDLDGTLVDSATDLAHALDRTLGDLGRPPAGLAKTHLWIGNGAQVLVRRGLADDMQHGDVDDELARRALDLFMGHYGKQHGNTRLYPGVAEALDWLARQGLGMAVITNKPQRFVIPLLQDVGIARHFAWVVGGDTLPRSKPDPDGLLHVLEKAGVAASQALFVGDSRNDIRAAKAALVRSVAMSYGYNHGRPIVEEAPDQVIDDMRELIDG